VDPISASGTDLGAIGGARRSKIRILLGSHSVDQRARSNCKARALDDTFVRPRIAPDLEAKILAVLKTPGRTEGVRKLAKRFGVDPGTVQRISRPFGDVSAAV
jgi:hypothetical protein